MDMDDTEIQRRREQSAKIVETLMRERPWKDQMWARCALAVAARAVRRGRLLTANEKDANLMKALAEDGDLSASLPSDEGRERS